MVDVPDVGALDMSVHIVRDLACVITIASSAIWLCPAAAAGDLSPQPSAITSAPVSQGVAIAHSPSPEPIGAGPQSASGGLLQKWNSAATELRIDIDIIAACRADPAACESLAATHMIAIVEEAQKRDGRARIGEINRAVNLAIAAASDRNQYSVEDKWASPLTTFASGRGDCEDYALAKYAALRAAGFDDADMRLLIVHLPRSQTDHAVLSVRHEGRWLILDNRRFALLDAAHLDAEPLFALRENDRPVYSAAASGFEPYLL